MPKGLGVDPYEQAEARRLKEEEGLSVRQIAAEMGIGRSTAHELISDAAREAGRARARARAGRQALGPVVVGDCIERMRAMAAGSVDAVVTDPPYGIGFMGHEWDQPGVESRAGGGGRRGHTANHARRPGAVAGEKAGGSALDAGRYDLSQSANRQFQTWCESWAREVLRVLKPGGHAVVFGSPRTYHRLAAGLEDAGLEIRDTIAWMFGSGFPKSMNVSQAIDRALGEQPTEVGRRENRGFLPRSSPTVALTTPTTPEAAAWDGWGTALKPGYEPIVLARKPLSGTVAATVLEHGTGAINIDGCRIDAAGAAGRWPANVLLDDQAAERLDEQTGELVSGANPTRRGSDKFRAAYGDFVGQREITAARGQDVGGASRFYYVAKASSAERNAGLDGLPTDSARPTMTPTSTLQRGRSGGQQVDDRTPERAPRANVHPTVKPIDVMRWLIRLVTPPGGTVLDPFLGSGTTAIAAHLEGRPVIGIERDEDYAALATARLAWWSQWAAGTPTSEVLAAWAGEDPARRERAAERRETAAREVGQTSLFEEAAA